MGIVGRGGAQRVPIRVLIAEDDYLVSQMIRGMLEGLGYIVAGEAINGQEAVDLVLQIHPDVVLMDWSMPDMDGITATQRIFELYPTPVVMLSAYSTRDLIARAGDVGAGAYIVKSPNRLELERAITIARARFDDMMELRRLNADLQARNKELDAFAGIVAHDLDTPLALLIGYAGTIELFNEELSDAEMATYLEHIVTNSRRMANIVDELLLLVQVRKSDVTLGPLRMDLIVQHALERLQDAIDAAAAEIVLPDEWPQVLGYASWVEEVWVNYLSNGLKYGGKPPHLQIGSVVVGNAVRYWLHDNGAGLTPEEQARLFQPFTRLDTIRIKGHGLGLSIVRFIIEKLDGAVAVESAKGNGSTFSFTLPIVG
ncbi:MAG: response regulator [Anaerolineae bacterium]|nr:response regulator [Anaerolineae bacterium]